MIAGGWRAQAEMIQNTSELKPPWQCSSKLYTPGSWVNTVWGITRSYENRDWVHSVCGTEHRYCVQVNCGPVKHWKIPRGRNVSKCVTMSPSIPQSTEVTSAPCTPPGKDVAIPFLRLMVDGCFGKKTSPPKHPLIVNWWALPSASNLADQCWTKGKSGATGGRGMRGQEPALCGSPDSPPKTLPPNPLLCVWPQDAELFPTAGQQDREEGWQGATSHRQGCDLQPRDLLGDALGLTGTEFCWGDPSHRQNYTLLSLLI